MLINVKPQNNTPLLALLTAAVFGLIATINIVLAGQLVPLALIQYCAASLALISYLSCRLHLAQRFAALLLFGSVNLVLTYFAATNPSYLYVFFWLAPLYILNFHLLSLRTAALISICGTIIVIWALLLQPGISLADINLRLSITNTSLASLCTIFMLYQLESRKTATQQKLSNELQLMENLSLLDPLTGLGNRRKINLVLTREIRRAARQAVPLSIVMLDIDNFKRLNDSLGHETGDEALVTVATLLLSGIRDIDVAGRMGGEEFIVILPDCPLSHAAEIADRLRQLIAESTAVTVSAGVSTLEQDDDEQSVLAKADALLYLAKQTGKNKVCCYN